VHSVRITTSMQNHNGLAIAQDTEAQATSQVARASHGDDAHTIEVTFAEAVSAASVPETITVRPDGDRGGTEADVEDIAGASASSITLRLGERAVAPAFHEIDLPASISYADGSPEFGGGTVTATFPGPRFGAAIRSATEIRVDFLEPVGFTAASGATAPLLSEWRVSLDPRSPGALTAPVAVSELGGMTRFTITMPSGLNSGRGLVLGTEPVVRYVPAGDPSIEGAGGRALLRILSNYSPRRMAAATATFPAGDVGGEGAVRDMVLAYELARHDMGRAVTHNKGIMNGIAAVATATGQDVRAIEAAAHAHASLGGAYSSLSEWSVGPSGDLVGRLEVPLAVGTVGGISGIHPTARVCAKVMRASAPADLACVMAAVGLAQNYSAMRALVTTGIQAGHMRLHARNLAIAAGAAPGRAGEVAGRMVSEGSISEARAREILAGRE